VLVVQASECPLESVAHGRGDVAFVPDCRCLGAYFRRDAAIVLVSCDRWRRRFAERIECFADLIDVASSGGHRPGASWRPMLSYSLAGCLSVVAGMILQTQAPVPNGPAAVYNGRSNQTHVSVPRVEQSADIDGVLDEPAWSTAAVLTGFSQFTPMDGRPAEDSTEVLVWYSPTAIYVGIRAYESHGAPHATLAKRDAIDGDDNVELLISTFADSRQAYVFAVNPLGVQEDGTTTEGRPPDPSGATGPTVVGRPPVDLTPDFVYDSKGRITNYGYEVEIRIPFKSIKYQSRDIQSWGFNVIRKVQHSGYEDTWTPASLAGTSFLAQSGTLDSLAGFRRGIVLDLNPTVTEKLNGGARGSARWRYAAERPQFGGNVRYGLTQNLTLNATIRPDFAEVESDVVQVQTDPRVAVFYPEKRPFFLDGIEQFATPVNTLIYTRQLSEPVAAAKLTGHLVGLNVAYLGAEDDKSTSLSGRATPVYNLVRVEGDVGAQGKLGVVATDVEERGDFNRVVGADAIVPFAGLYTLTLQGATSSTRAGGRTTAGPIWHAELTRNGHIFHSDLMVDALDPQFETLSGFVSQPNVATIAWLNQVTIYGATPASFVQSARLITFTAGVWPYRQFTSAHAAEQVERDLDTRFTFRGGWTGGVSFWPDYYRYDPTLFPAYFVGHQSSQGTVYTPFRGGGILQQTVYYFLLGTPQFAHFSADVAYRWGLDKDFFEWASADQDLLTVSATWRPTRQLRVAPTLTWLEYRRHSDGSTVASHRVPRLDIEYQLSRSIYVRIVGQYDAQFRDSLRDEVRTGLPLFIQTGPGTYSRLGQSTTNTITGQALFAYQPVPGTVLFLGYNNGATESESFHFGGLRRTADGFFAKFSYLFRTS
jgi:hypothetical protein